MQRHGPVGASRGSGDAWFRIHSGTEALFEAWSFVSETKPTVLRRNAKSVWQGDCRFGNEANKAFDID
jgi:hypothetical protein